MKHRDPTNNDSGTDSREVPTKVGNRRSVGMLAPHDDCRLWRHTLASKWENSDATNNITEEVTYRVPVVSLDTKYIEEKEFKKGKRKKCHVTECKPLTFDARYRFKN